MFGAKLIGVFLFLSKVLALKAQANVDGFISFDESSLSALLGGNGNVEESRSSARRVVRSSSGDSSTSEDGDSGKSGNTDSVSRNLIEAICNTKTANNTSSKEELLCHILKKISLKAPATVAEEYLPDNYDKYEAPQGTKNITLRNRKVITLTTPVECQVFLNVRGIVDFNEGDGLVTLDMDVIMLWTDANIMRKFQGYSDEEKDNLNPVVLSPEFLKKMWTPDIYIEEVMSLTQPTFMGNSITVVLTPATGLLVYRSRVLVKLSCGMDFTFYPADTQQCTFTLKSFSYITDKLQLSWALQGGTGVYLQETEDPNFGYQISSFTSNETFLNIGPASDPSTLYSSLQFTLLARRKMTYQLVQTYFASIFFVLVTWLCFLISPDMFEVRVGVSMSTLLTLTAMFASVREETPKVSYVKAIDIWMVASILFIFLALAGFTVTAWIKRGLSRMQAPKEDSDEISLDVLGYQKKRILDEVETKQLRRKYRITAILIERLGIYILSFAYISFNILYWTWLLHESNYLAWSVNSTYNNV